MLGKYVRPCVCVFTCSCVSLGGVRASNEEYIWTNNVIVFLFSSVYLS